MRLLAPSLARSFVSQGTVGMQRCNSEAWSQGRFDAWCLRSRFPAGISQQPKSSINKAKRLALGCKAARPVTDPISYKKRRLEALNLTSKQLTAAEDEPSRCRQARAELPQCQGDGDVSSGAQGTHPKGN